MNLFSTSSLILCLSSIFFSLIVYRNDRSNRVSRAWLYASISFSGWSLGLYGVTSTVNPNYAVFWQYLCDVSAIFLPALYLNFLLELFKFKAFKWRIFFMLLAGALSIFSFTDYFKHGVVPRYDFFWVDPGQYYLVFPIYFICHAIIAVFIMLYQYIKNSQDRVLRGQIRNTMLAGIMGYVGGVSNFFP